MVDDHRKKKAEAITDHAAGRYRTASATSDSWLRCCTHSNDAVYSIARELRG